MLWCRLCLGFFAGMKSFIVGSYATSPNLYALEHQDSGIGYDADREAAFYDGLAALHTVGGLEIQLDGEGLMHSFDEAQFLAEFARPHWTGVLTCIGGTMANVGANSAFGLASTDAAGRGAALDFARKARAAVARWHARPGAAEAGGAIIAVEVHSAPNTTKGTASSAEAFAMSLAEMSAWDWQGATLVVEHCDTAGPLGLPSKGFLTLADDIAAVQIANESLAEDKKVRCCINWARSTLETHDPATVETHLMQCVQAGVLAALMFSGCTGESNAFGPWKDCHMPHAKADGAEHWADGSVMTAQSIDSCVKAAQASPLLYCGCKITSLATGHWVGDAESDVTVRVGLNRDLLSIISKGFE